MRFELDETLVRDFLAWSVQLHLDNSGQHPCDLLSIDLENQLPKEGRDRHMRVFQVGPETIDVDRFDFDWIVYWYETGSYDGRGRGYAAYKKDGKFGWVNLSHCSCYGPEDQVGSAEMDILGLMQDLRTEESDCDHEYMSAVFNKVVELEFENWETIKRELGL